MKLRLLVVLVFLVTPPVLAQGPPNRAALQRQIIERLITNFGNQAALTDQQLTQFRESVMRSFRERRQIEAHQRRLLLALEGQLRPGVAADVDSLHMLMQSLQAAGQALVDLSTKDQAEFASFLNPIQQAQLILFMQRFQRQVDAQLRRRLSGARPGSDLR